MRILEVAGSGGIGKDYMGPITRDITLLSNELAKLGNDVSVVDAKNNVDRKYLNTKDINLIEVNSPIWPKNGEIKSIQKLVSSCPSEALLNNDIIHVHDWKIGALITKYYNINCVYTAHTPQKWAGSCGNWKNKLNYYLKRTLGIHEYNYIKRSRLTIVLGSYLKRIFNTSNIKVIPNGIDIERWCIENSARQKLNLDENEFLILYVGRIHKTKGIHLLIYALKQLNYNNIKLVIIGKFNNKEYSKYIKQLAVGQDVVLPGFISNRSAQFTAYLSAADIFVVPSLCDNQPNVVLEALSMSLPIIASNVGGIPDMLNDEVGLLFERGDITGLTNHIKYLYENADIRKKMSLNCRHHVINNYTWHICAKKHMIEFEKIL